MNDNLNKAAVVLAACAAGALATWAIINWLPSVTILAGAAGAGYVAYLKVK